MCVCCYNRYHGNALTVINVKMLIRDFGTYGKIFRYYLHVLS
jgi:hypothetical protein